MASYDSDGTGDAGQFEITWENLPSQCQHIFLKYLKKNDPQTKCSALRGLSGVFLACPRQMLEMNNSGLIRDVMSASAHHTLQMESLKCWRDILLVRFQTLSVWEWSLVSNFDFSIFFLWLAGRRDAC
jgi:hypothetical protein